MNFDLQQGRFDFGRSQEVEKKLSVGVPVYHMSDDSLLWLRSTDEMPIALALPDLYISSMADHVSDFGVLSSSTCYLPSYCQPGG